MLDKQTSGDAATMVVPQTGRLTSTEDPAEPYQLVALRPNVWVTQ